MMLCLEDEEISEKQKKHIQELRSALDSALIALAPLSAEYSEESEPTLFKEKVASQPGDGFVGDTSDDEEMYEEEEWNDKITECVKRSRRARYQVSSPSR